MSLFKHSVLLLFFNCFTKFVLSVDRSAFKTCDESSFCKRHRHYSPTQSPYIIVPNSITFQDSSFVARLEHTLTKRQLTCTVTSYGDSRIGFMIDEIDPLRLRYKVNDAFAKRPIKRGFRDSQIDTSSATLLTLDGQKIVIQFVPFRLDVLDKDELVMSLNSQGLLKFEHFRKKEESSPAEKSGPNEADNDKAEENDGQRTNPPLEPSAAPIDSDDQEKEAHEKDRQPKYNETESEDGMGEEHWKSHHDSKPYGASSVGMDISLIGFKHTYGLPEHADNFVLKSTKHSEPYRLFNLDVAEYELHNPMALYGSIPYIMGHNARRTVGLMWLNPSETWVDIKSSIADKSLFRSLLDKFKSDPEIPQIDTHWMSEAGLVDVYLFFGPNPVDVFRQFSDFFGTSGLPPYFSIAYHQCRWNYNDIDDVKNVDANFDHYDIPYDTLWLDVEHTDGKRYFTWDPNKFDKPKEMLDQLGSKCRKLVTIVDPHIKKDDNYYIYKEANDKKFFVKTKDGSVYEGWCWPGASMYLDFFNPEVRDWWASKYAYDSYTGTNENVHIWNDMNEPSVFNGPEITIHKDTIHHDGWENREVHNLYGFYNHMATHKGLVKRDNGKKRPFILTRSFFVGSQRYAAVWTGDNTAEWSHLQITFAMLFSLGVAGIPFVGADVGGFFKNPEEELVVRWYQAGAFNPFYRAHAHLDTKRREPWLFSAEARSVIREAVILRYQMLPYWYTVFFEHTLTGLPILRPLWVEFPQDPYTFDEENEAFVGSGILVRPVVESKVSSVSVYLPGEKTMWYEWDTFKGQPGPGATRVETPISKIPIFIRGGSIIPLKMRIKRSSCLTKHDPMTLYVALDYAGKFANGTLYFDDGESFDYQKHINCYRLFVYTGDQFGGSLTNNKISGEACKTDVWVEKIVVMGLQYHPRGVSSDAFTGKVHHYYESNARVLTIRKPAVNIGSDWRIDIFS